MKVISKRTFYLNRYSTSPTDYKLYEDGRVIPIRQVLPNSDILPVILMQRFRSLVFDVAEGIQLQVYRGKNDRLIMRYVEK